MLESMSRAMSVLRLCCLRIIRAGAVKSLVSWRIVIALVSTAVTTIAATSNDTAEKKKENLQQHHQNSDPEPKPELLVSVASLCQLLIDLLCIHTSVLIGTLVKNFELLELFDVGLVRLKIIVDCNSNNRSQDGESTASSESLDQEEWLHEA